jgi:hypothetical protein
VEVLFVGVPEIKIEVRHGGQSSLPQRHYILDDCGASQQREFVIDEPVKRITYQRMLFPEPATIIRNDQYLGVVKGQRRRTFAMDPQQGGGRLGLPFHEYTSLEEPCRRPFMLSPARDILISRRVRRRQPLSVVRPYPGPCSSISVSAIKSRGAKESRTSLFVHVVRCLLHQSLCFLAI